MRQEMHLEGRTIWWRSWWAGQGWVASATLPSRPQITTHGGFEQTLGYDAVLKYRQLSAKMPAVIVI